MIVRDCVGDTFDLLNTTAIVVHLRDCVGDTVYSLNATAILVIVADCVGDAFDLLIQQLLLWL